MDEKNRKQSGPDNPITDKDDKAPGEGLTRAEYDDAHYIRKGGEDDVTSGGKTGVQDLRTPTGSIAPQFVAPSDEEDGNPPRH